MRRFHSYGPVDYKQHFCVNRNNLVQKCFKNIIGESEEDSGHYFTIWAPRQTGKTWLMREVKKKIEEKFKDNFIVGTMSMQGVIIKDDEPEEIFLTKVPLLFEECFKIKKISTLKDWESFKSLFKIENELFNKPIILFIDEFDSLPPKIIDRLVTIFRDMYLKRESYILHGLALIGVRSVLGVDSLRGSPFNIQRSLHVPNFIFDEVKNLFDQYIKESGQPVISEVIANLFETTSGQPGLIGWFGELLTETYNLGKDRPVDLECWKNVLEAALHVEWNNTILNIVKKVRAGYQEHVLRLFTNSDIQFSIDSEWCSWLYLNGVIAPNVNIDSKGNRITFCRFSCPFIQKRLYNALTYDLIGDRIPILALHPLDELTDVFDKNFLDLSALLNRYRDYLKRLKAKNINPFKDQPRRSDLHLTEAVGHFHLYAWLKEAIGRQCIVSPEFPTGNGKVDLFLRCDSKQGIIEVKSFINATETKSGRIQAARYAASLGFDRVTLALFVPVTDETILKTLSGSEIIDGVLVNTEAIGWE